MMTRRVPVILCAVGGLLLPQAAESQVPLRTWCFNIAVSCMNVYDFSFAEAAGATSFTEGENNGSSRA